MIDEHAIKRSAPRIQPFVTQCRVLDGSRVFSGYLTDLSIQGAQVNVTVRPPEPGATVVLQVRLAGRPSRTRLPSEVRWVRSEAGAEGGHSFGVAFRDLTADERQTLEAVLEDIRKRVAELA